MKDNIPKEAIKIPFQVLGQKRSRYYIWSKQNRYYWSAQGNSGQEVTMDAAMAAARDWIRFGVSGLKSHGEYHGVLNASR